MARLTTAGGLMILVNIGFLIAGILLLRFKATLESSGWADALTDTEYENTANAATTMVLLLGGIAITMAIVGIIGAIIQNRLLLLLYSVIMVVAMSAFGVLAGTAFTFKTKMTDWKDTAFPAEGQETKLAETFNAVYCYAEGYYYCNNATAQEAYETFFPNASTTLVSLLPNVTGITSVCSDLQGTVDGLSTCRTIFLDVAIDWSGTMVIAGLLSAIAAAAIVALACFARRSKSSDERMTKV
ncbi:hypothetical protein BBO99_00000806 [Phytophthora kernoviae]|uniref:Tetraspanin n=2 Tax=Phytophthora kernoviae TaxID=325452 RepID=A0A3R7K3P1_9STRA|nr:hypothetical protein G195_005813 [Phytophthora kernoviae 00238/432]KAG2526053.1 hypothetical protein JM18_004589 [Phytophthora kernoviae]RLN46781.1 hypothetical protein BBI17_000629 [Phytophthora kernoviae]RLN85132.1 hypothetical protein BBO99_00000806 [Phytophthora kernoviae]